MPERAHDSAAAEGGHGVTVRPVLAVTPGHVAEARRALAAHGRVVDDDALTRYLWVARALPVALDAIAATGVLAGVTLGAPTVMARGSQLGGTQLVGVAHLEEAAVVVELIEAGRIETPDGGPGEPRCAVTIPFTCGNARDGVAVRRFTLRTPASDR